MLLQRQMRMLDSHMISEAIWTSPNLLSVAADSCTPENATISDKRLLPVALFAVSLEIRASREAFGVLTTWFLACMQAESALPRCFGLLVQ